MSASNRQTYDHESVLYLGIHAFVNFYKKKQLSVLTKLILFILKVNVRNQVTSYLNYY